MADTGIWASAYDWLLEADPVLGGIGFILTIAGFWVAFVQLRKTRRSAAAAEAAATNAEQQIRSVLAVASLHEICSRSRDLLHLTRARNLAAAANAAFELREALARFCATGQALTLQPESQWLDSTAAVASIHERLESAATINRIDTDGRTLMLHEIAAEHQKFSSLAARAAQGRNSNANPQ